MMEDALTLFPGEEALEEEAEAVLVRVHLLALLDAIDARQGKERSPLRRSRSNSPSGSFSSSPAMVRSALSCEWWALGRGGGWSLTVSCNTGGVGAAKQEGEGLHRTPARR